MYAYMLQPECDHARAIEGCALQATIPVLGKHSHSGVLLFTSQVIRFSFLAPNSGIQTTPLQDAPIPHMSVLLPPSALFAIKMPNEILSCAWPPH